LGTHVREERGEGERTQWDEWAGALGDLYIVVEGGEGATKGSRRDGAWRSVDFILLGKPKRKVW
jgi:hypothetical protein